MLVKGGRFIASAPVTPSMDANPFHQTDFTIKSFKKLFTSAGLVEIDFTDPNSAVHGFFNDFKKRRKRRGSAERTGRLLPEESRVNFSRG